MGFKKRIMGSSPTPQKMHQKWEDFERWGTLEFRNKKHLWVENAVAWSTGKV